MDALKNKSLDLVQTHVGNQLNKSTHLPIQPRLFCLKTLAAAIILTAVPYAYAGDVCEVEAGTVSSSSAIGQNALACGNLNDANGDYSMALGYANHAEKESAIAIGRENHAEGATSTAVGSFNFASYAGSVAVGGNNSAIGSGSSAIGGHTNPLGDGGVELGYDENGFVNRMGHIPVQTTSQATDWSQIQASEIIAISAHDRLTLKEKEAFLNSIRYGGNIALMAQSNAIGTANTAVHFGASALGAGNVATGEASSAVGSYNWALADHATAIGYQNDAVGEDSSALGHANQALAEGSSAVGHNNIASGHHASALGYANEASGEDSVAVGHTNIASGHHASALGYENQASGEDSVAVGHTNITNGEEAVAFGSNNYVIGDGSVALGSSIGPTFDIEYDDEDHPTKIERISGLTVTATGTEIKDIIAIGSYQLSAADIAALERRQEQGGNIVLGWGSSAIGINNFASDNGNVAIGFLNAAGGQVSTALGTSNVAEGNFSSAVGFMNSTTAQNSVAMGYANSAEAVNSSVFGVESQATAEGATAIGYQSIADRANTVSVGQAGLEKQITNVAAATEATDAVNLSQMQAANQQIEKQVHSLESVFSQQRFETDRRFEQVDQRFDRQGAMSAAMMNMATSTSGLAGRNRLGVGAGFQGSEQAVAVGYQRVINNNTSLSLSGAFSEKESSGGAGVGISW